MIIGQEQYLKVKDSKGTIHKWLIEEETKDSYKIFCNGYITEIKKKHTYIKDGVLFTSDIRNPWCTFDNKKYMRADFFEIWKD